jgi:hypothetical protein
MKYLKAIVRSIVVVFACFILKSRHISGKADISVKILVGYHKPAALLNDKKVFVPIHLGRAVSRDVPVRNSVQDGVISEENYRWLLKNMIGDDTGDNISLQNRDYAELTAAYWAWKNLDKLGNPDYVGLMHYRRHFAFKSYGKIEWLINVDSIDDKYQKQYGLNSEQIEKTIAGYDIVVLLTPMAVYDQYREVGGWIELLDTALQVLREKYSEYSDTSDEHMKSTDRGYMMNMFVMKRELFKEYCNWIFDISEETMNRLIGKNQPDKEFSRFYHTTIGHAIERLFGVFVKYKQKTAGIRVLELPVCIIEHPEKGVKF